MDWSNERYVRVYTRDTTTWKLMDWRGRVVLSLLIRKVDRAGVLDVGHDGVLGLSAVLELPLEIVEAGIAQLTTCRGGSPTVLDTGSAYVMPNFIDAQEATQSDPQRKRESRATRRDRAVSVSRNVTTSSVTDRNGHETSRYRDENTEPVTPIRILSGSDPNPSLAEPSRSRDPASASPPPPPTSEPRDGSIRGDPKPRASRRKGALTPIPEDWNPRPSEVAKAGAMGLNADDQSERFRNHHGARGSVFANWDQAFRSWLDKAQEFSANRNGHRGPSRSIADIALDRALEAEAREKGTA